MSVSETKTESSSAQKSGKGPVSFLQRGTLRKKLRREARIARALKLRKEPEFAKTYFEAKSKRSTARKVAYRKRHAKKV